MFLQEGQSVLACVLSTKDRHPTLRTKGLNKWPLLKPIMGQPYNVPLNSHERHALEAKLMTWENVYGLLLSEKSCLQNRMYSMKTIM